MNSLVLYFGCKMEFDEDFNNGCEVCNCRVDHLGLPLLFDLANCLLSIQLLQ